VQRISSPDPGSLPTDVANLLAFTAPAGGEPPGTVAVLAHVPALLGPFLGWAAALALNGALPKRDHELLALRVAFNCRSAFEWGEHAGYARAAGLTDADLQGVADGAGAAGWSANERALLLAADELQRDTVISDTTWAALVGHYDAGCLVEIPFVVGQYAMLSMVAEALGVPVPPGLDRLPEPF
jgi:4-carboxymuconolactone decarboxylase